MDCAYQPFPTQRTEEILEINRENDSVERKLLDKEYESKTSQQVPISGMVVSAAPIWLFKAMRLLCK